MDDKEIKMGTLATAGDYADAVALRQRMAVNPRLSAAVAGYAQAVDQHGTASGPALVEQAWAVLETQAAEWRDGKFVAPSRSVVLAARTPRGPARW